MDWPKWDVGDAPLPAAAGEVVMFHLQPRDADAARLLLELPLADQERAGRLRVERSRLEFIVGRATLRRLLARATSRDAATLPFEVGEHGKPELPGCPLAFNVAHAGGEVLIGLGMVPALGVDLEPLREGIEVLALAEDHFPAEEHAALAALPEPLRTALFFRLWTAREAVLKAHGGGLTVPLRAFTLGVANTADAPETVSVPEPDRVARRFALQRLVMKHGWEAALAVEGGPPLHLRTGGLEI